MTADEEEGKRAAKVEEVLRPLGQRPLTRDQRVAVRKLLGTHWTIHYRLRRRFLADLVASAMSGRSCGPKSGDRRLAAANYHITNDVILRRPVRRRAVRSGLLEKEGVAVFSYRAVRRERKMPLHVSSQWTLM
jgi:putative transposase